MPKCIIGPNGVAHGPMCKDGRLCGRRDNERKPPKTMSSEEREALEWAVIAAETFRDVPAKQPWGLCDSSVSSEQANKYGATLRGLLEGTKTENTQGVGITAALSSPRKDVDMTQDDAGSAPMLGSVANRLAASLRDMNDEILARGADYSDILLDAARELDRRSWIPVTARLPPHDETVLFTCDLGPNEGFTDVAAGRWEGGRNNMGLPAMSPAWNDEVVFWGPCSHWMPLPPPPSDDK